MQSSCPDLFRASNWAFDSTGKERPHWIAGTSPAMTTQSKHRRRAGRRHHVARGAAHQPAFEDAGGVRRVSQPRHAEGDDRQPHADEHHIAVGDFARGETLINLVRVI